jgi:hypothetical protein
MRSCSLNVLTPSFPFFVFEMQDSSKLFLGTLSGSVQILDLSSLNAGSMEVDSDGSSVQTLSEHVPVAEYTGDLSSDEEGEEAGKPASKGGKARKKLGLLRLLAPSSDGQFLAVADDLNQIWVYSLDSGKIIANLPIFAHPVLSLVFSPSQPSVVAVLTTRNHLYLYDVISKKMTDYSKTHLAHIAAASAGGSASAVAAGTATTAAWNTLARDQFTGISFDRSRLTNSNSLVLQGVNSMLFVNLDAKFPSGGISAPVAGAQPGTQAEGHGHSLRRDRKRKAEEAAAAVATGGAAGEESASERPASDPFED